MLLLSLSQKQSLGLHRSYYYHVAICAYSCADHRLTLLFFRLFWRFGCQGFRPFEVPGAWAETQKKLELCIWGLGFWGSKDWWLRDASCSMAS